MDEKPSIYDVIDNPSKGTLTRLGYDDSYGYISEAFSLSFMTPPTRKQFKYAESYLKYEDDPRAYAAAGYNNIDHLKERTKRLRYVRIRKSVGVQNLFRAAHQWVKRNKLTAERKCQMALDCYNNAERMSDRLRALRLLGEFSGTSPHIPSPYNVNYYHKSKRPKISQ